MSDTPKTECWGIAANIVEDGALRDGAKVIVKSWGQGHPVVYGLNFHGRKITKYANYGNLFNFRPVLLPPNLEGVHLSFATKDKAQECCPKEDCVNP